MSLAAEWLKVEVQYGPTERGTFFLPIVKQGRRLFRPVESSPPPALSSSPAPATAAAAAAAASPSSALSATSPSSSTTTSSSTSSSSLSLATEGLSYLQSAQPDHDVDEDGNVIEDWSVVIQPMQQAMENPRSSPPPADGPSSSPSSSSSSSPSASSGSGGGGGSGGKKGGPSQSELKREVIKHIGTQYQHWDQAGWQRVDDFNEVSSIESAWILAGRCDSMVVRLFGDVHRSASALFPHQLTFAFPSSLLTNHQRPSSRASSRLRSASSCAAARTRTRPRRWRT